MRKLISLVAVALVGVGLTAVPSPAIAADTDTAWSYAAYSGATYIKVGDAAVKSDTTAPSAVSGDQKSGSSSNSTAGVTVNGLLKVGAVQSTTSADYTPAKTTLKSWIRTAGVNLLDGLITADAVETTVTTTGNSDGTTSKTAKSDLVNLKIIGVNLPVTIPENFAVTIPKVATITLNYSLHARTSDPDAAATMGWAIGVTLLEPRSGFALGTTIVVNPANHILAVVDKSSGAQVFGGAYGTRIRAAATSGVQVVSDRTANVAAPAPTSHGKTLTSTTLGVNVPAVLNTGAVATSSTSNRDDIGNAELTHTSRVAGVNLLGGIVKADAIEVKATSKLQDGVWTHSEEMKLVNLVIAGNVIPIDVAPNTAINVAGLGKVELNKRVISVGGKINGIYGVLITLDTAQAGLPIGATVEIAVAANGIVPMP